MSASKAARAFILLGECVPCVKQNASRFQIKRLELDPHLLMYFRKDNYVYAHDPGKKCKTGDIVLLEQLPEKLTKLITHKVKEIVHPLGDVTCPFTQKKVVAGRYRDHVEAVIKVYGKFDTAFDYEKAAERGWLEDKKDFSHAEIYRKYHEFEDDKQPYAV
ncbi:Ribosomal protein S17 [Popillia japonica]|uniref:Ribosomal protein S17 n=1 Tax=Popillia japonica TaxID=7064 RepID=A0AAW1MG67_POPJA